MNRNLPFIKSIKPNPLSVVARLPQIYKDFRSELKKEPSPVHYIPEPGKWMFRVSKEYRYPVQNVPIPLKFPKQADEGLWGGEAVIQGFTKFKVKRRRKPTFWIPNLKKAVVYSEILNKYMSVTVTERTLQLIDNHCGLDNYIFETPVQDLNSQLAFDLRRKMLFTLIDKEKIYDDMSQQEKVWKKYEKFIIPREEAEWFGLSVRAAVKKQRLIEEEVLKPIPLKEYYRKKYFEKLEADTLEGEEKKSWMSKVPFLGKLQAKDKTE